jgi:carbamoyltransferase
VLINTSFNVKGEPIVETPRDAIDCFLSTGIDVLILHETLVTKTAFHRAVSPLMGMYSEISSIVRAGLQSDKD